MAPNVLKIPEVPEKETEEAIEGEVKAPVEEVEVGTEENIES